MMDLHGALGRVVIIDYLNCEIVIRVSNENLKNFKFNEPVELHKWEPPCSESPVPNSTPTLEAAIERGRSYRNGRPDPTTYVFDCKFVPRHDEYCADCEWHVLLHKVLPSQTRRIRPKLFDTPLEFFAERGATT